ncbi:YhcN/YlaJ family sporulation lipoprotein [Neobacillus sp. PS3-40]|uniref:YhcN/YlaJ family sporulation lipoprotein n=1 Tax=Neobacillus sp. PS3-40 TaxID=3070679 RepID=UPI0027E03C7B|nr:YhcN/YlaJ family sporulation lipoprotein [Neobacillus sp. PS3-40]WML43571.1 YhcN/YlaJ family sporulation lipoprotein [Neobacillus sp. PS3-40]
MKKILIISVIFSILTGCNFHSGVQKNEKQQFIHVKNSYIQKVDKKSGQEISKRLVMLASSIPNVNDATAVVLGRYAIVGIDVNSKIDRSQVGTIKYSVAESLKNDPYGAKAIVVADPDTTQRLKEISAEIKKGRPIQGIMNELSDVAGRLMPEVPGDLINPTPKNGMQDQKKKLSPNEKKSLDKKQEQESNYKK